MSLQPTQAVAYARNMIMQTLSHGCLQQTLLNAKQLSFNEKFDTFTIVPCCWKLSLIITLTKVCVHKFTKTSPNIVPVEQFFATNRNFTKACPNSLLRATMQQQGNFHMLSDTSDSKQLKLQFGINSAVFCFEQYAIFLS